MVKTLTDPADLPIKPVEQAEYTQFSNPWSQLTVYGHDKKTGKKKEQKPTYVYMNVHTRFDLDHVLGLIQGSLGERDIVVRVKEFPFLDTKTRFALVGTSNAFCHNACEEVLQPELEKHEEYMMREEGLHKEYAKDPFPAFMIRKSHLKLTEQHVLTQDEVDYLEYFGYLRYSNVFEVADVDFPPFSAVLKSFDAAGGIKRIISDHAHVLELHHTRVSDTAKIKWYKQVTTHMNYNHAYTVTEVPGVLFLDYAIRVEI